MLSQMVVALSRIKAGKDVDEVLDELDIYKPTFNNVCRVVESTNINSSTDQSDFNIESEVPAPTLSSEEKLFCAILRSQDLTLVPSDIKSTMLKAIETLTDKEQEVLKKRFYEGMKYSEISKEYNVSGERIRQIESKALRKLRDPHTLSYIKLGEAFYKDCKKVALEKEVIAERKRLATMQELASEYLSIQSQEQALHKKFPDLDLNSSSDLIFVGVDELGLSSRAFHALRRENINTVRELGLRNAYDLLQIRNLGKRGVAEIADAYDRFTGQKFDRIDFISKYNTEMNDYLSATKNRYIR